MIVAREKMREYKTVDEYILTFPADIQKILEKVRQAIREAAPEATEGISYGMPAYKSDGILVYFAAHKNHVGFYPTASGIAAFQKELAAYRSSRALCSSLWMSPFLMI